MSDFTIIHSETDLPGKEDLNRYFFVIKRVVVYDNGKAVEYSPDEDADDLEYYIAAYQGEGKWQLLQEIFGPIFYLHEDEDKRPIVPSATLGSNSSKSDKRNYQQRYAINSDIIAYAPFPKMPTRPELFSVEQKAD